MKKTVLSDRTPRKVAPAFPSPEKQYQTKHPSPNRQPLHLDDGELGATFGTRTKAVLLAQKRRMLRNRRTRQNPRSRLKVHGRRQTRPGRELTTRSVVCAHQQIHKRIRMKIRPSPARLIKRRQTRQNHRIRSPVAQKQGPRCVEAAQRHRRRLHKKSTQAGHPSLVLHYVRKAPTPSRDQGRKRRHRQSLTRTKAVPRMRPAKTQKTNRTSHFATSNKKCELLPGRRLLPNGIGLTHRRSMWSAPFSPMPNVLFCSACKTPIAGVNTHRLPWVLRLDAYGPD